MDEKYTLNWMVAQIFQNTFTLTWTLIDMTIIWKVEITFIQTRLLSTWKYNN